MNLHKPLDPELLSSPRWCSTAAYVRAWEALMLARTPEAWSQLLQGNPVPADQLDSEYLARCKARRAL